MTSPVTIRSGRNGLGERTPLGRLATPDDVARVVHFLVGDGSSIGTGQHVAVDGGASI